MSQGAPDVSAAQVLSPLDSAAEGDLADALERRTELGGTFEEDDHRAQ